MTYLAVFSFGAMFAIVGLSWFFDFIENRNNNSWQKRVTVEDLEELGRLLRE